MSGDYPKISDTSASPNSSKIHTYLEGENQVLGSIHPISGVNATPVSHQKNPQFLRTKINYQINGS